MRMRCVALPRAGTRTRWVTEACGVADGDGNFGGGVAGVGEVDGDQPIVTLGVRGKDAVDGDVGKALVGVDPIGEEPGEIAAEAGLLDELLEVV